MRLILNKPTIHVRASATAGVTTSPTLVRILVLDPSASGALTLTGQGSINAGSGGVYVNSTDSKALQIKGQGSITAGIVNVVGDVKFTGQGQVNGTIVTGGTVMADPLAKLPAPDLGSYPISPDSGGNVTTPGSSSGPASGTVMRPGIYYGGIDLTGQDNITLLPGVYILAGGGLRMTGQGSITGDNVMIYNTGYSYTATSTDKKGNTVYTPASVPCGDITITGQGDLHVTAPTDGTYKGILIFNDRNSSPAVTLHGQGIAGNGPTGYIYNPNGSITLTGQGDIGCVGAIANTIRQTGQGNINAPDIIHTPSTPQVRLVE